MMTGRASLILLFPIETTPQAGGIEETAPPAVTPPQLPPPPPSGILTTFNPSPKAETLPYCRSLLLNENSPVQVHN
ncbi:unnamed protein product [Rodentolepis nana]|uniref:Secreted protein n=1 Tax=Rodentolepis nana TaxID=102285 RepID=A0A0R3TRN0_RODNA|nr:unnamed protein product [Rodentolepis nana]